MKISLGGSGLPEERDTVVDVAVWLESEELEDEAAEGGRAEPRGPRLQGPADRLIGVGFVRRSFQLRALVL